MYYSERNILKFAPGNNHEVVFLINFYRKNSKYPTEFVEQSLQTKKVEYYEINGDPNHFHEVSLQTSDIDSSDAYGESGFEYRHPIYCKFSNYDYIEPSFIGGTRWFVGKNGFIYNIPSNLLNRFREISGCHGVTSRGRDESYYYYYNDSNTNNIDQIKIAYNFKNLTSKNFYVDCNDQFYLYQVDINNGNQVYRNKISHRSCMVDRCYVTFYGYSSFTVYVRSYAESIYDYLIVGNLDTEVEVNTSSTIKYSTKGNQSASSFTAVTFTGMSTGQHYFEIVYRKDGSIDSNDDAGYFYIPKQ